MTEIIGKFIDYFNSPKYLLVISLVTGFLIFGEVDIVNRMELLLFVENYKLWIGIVFLISTGFWVVNLILWIIDIIKSKYKAIQTNKACKGRLKQLTIEEKVILGKYIFGEIRTQKLDFSNGIVHEFEYYNIIYRSSNFGYIGAISYNIQPWAWEYLNKHKNLLHVPLDQVK